MDLLLGVDVGTSSCKVTAVTRQGTVAASSTQGYPIHRPRPGWAEQDPEDWYRAACRGIRACLAGDRLEPSQVAGVAVDGPAHNVALMDEAGRILRPTIHWSDLRSARQSERLVTQYGERIFQLTYQRVNPSWTLAQLLWFGEHEPDIWSRLRRVLVTKDYVRYRFTGTYETDAYDAIGTQLYDTGDGRWSEELCDLVGFRADWLPPVSSAWAIAGALLPEAARDAGLPAGTPVAVGSGDTVMEAYAVGAVDPGQCIVKLGSAACMNVVTARPHPMRDSLTYCHVIPGRWFTIMATNSGASTQRWFRETFFQSQVESASADIYQAIGQLAAAAPPGCEGLLFHPYLMGERSPYWDPRLRGDFVGIGAHHDLRHFARAILEGVAFSVRDCALVAKQLPQPITDRRLTGGGAESLLWRRILCDVLGHPLIKPATGDAALGSALLAGVAAGLFPDWQSALAACPLDEELLHPDPAVHALYDEYFDIYRDVAHDLARHSHRLADLADREPVNTDRGATRADQEA